MRESIIAKENPITIVDVGASRGVHPRWSKLAPHFKGILFEPDPREYNILKANSDSNLIVLNSALSDSAKNIDFHLCKKQTVSSVYRPNFEFLQKFPDHERFIVEKTINIKSDTLYNQLIMNDISEVDFIKLDTQGYELPILMGAGDFLNNVIGLEVEVEFVEMYKEQPLFNQVDEFISGHNFDLVDIKRYFWKRIEAKGADSGKGQLIFADALYFKSPEAILAMPDVTEGKIIRATCIYLAYGYKDLARALMQDACNKGLLSNNSYDSMMRQFFKSNLFELIPDFKGRGRLRSLFQSIANALDVGPYSGIDRDIGN